MDILNHCGLPFNGGQALNVLRYNIYANMHGVPLILFNSDMSVMPGYGPIFDGVSISSSQNVSEHFFLQIHNEMI